MSEETATPEAIIRNALLTADRDIGEWLQLARRQRAEMQNADYNPLCPTVHAISSSEIRQFAIGKALQELRQLEATMFLICEGLMQTKAALRKLVDAARSREWDSENEYYADGGCRDCRSMNYKKHLKNCPYATAIAEAERLLK